MSNGLTRKNINAQPAVVQVLNVDGATSKGSDQVNLALVEKVVFPAGEAGVGLLLNLENDVTGLDTRCLVTFAAELDLGAAANALVDMDVKDLAVDNCLLTIALLATVLLADDFTLSVTVGADGLEALNHGAHLAHHGLHAVAVTACAALDSAILATEALALGADDGALEGQLGDLAAVDVLERDLVSVVNGAGLGGSAVHTTAKHAAHAAETTTAEELGKQVLGSHAAAASTTALEAGLAILVVDLSLLGIRENFVGVRDFLELFLGVGVVCVLVYRAQVSAVAYTGACQDRDLPGWCFRAPTLYAFLSSASVAVGATWTRLLEPYR